MKSSKYVYLFIFTFLIVAGCTVGQLETADTAAQTAQDVTAVASEILHNPVVTTLVPAPITTAAGYLIAAISGVAALYQSLRKKKYAQATTEIVKGIEIYKTINGGAKSDINVCLDRAESQSTKAIVREIKN